MKENPMRQIGIEKITLNVGCGASSEKLEKATKLLSTISSEKAVSTKTKKRIPTWGVRPGLEIGTKITLRGKKAEATLKRLLNAVKYLLESNNFDQYGNFSFGISEYLNIPDLPYDQSIGIMGLEVAVTLKRPGFGIKNRSIKRKKIPNKHRITKEEAINFVKEKFNVKVS